MHTSKTNPFKRKALTSALLAAIVVPGAAFAQDSSADSSNASGEKATNLDRVSVVGSRIKRVDLEGPAPVTVITRDDIDREGFQTVGDMLQTLTQNTTGSFTGDLAVNGFTPNAQVVNLRGMGPGYTLTLINGRRPAQYPQPYNRDNNVVNVRAIPSSIVERVEILTGGASAIYGSDAVAGVVNLVLRKNYDGTQLRGTVGTTAEGGGDNAKFELTGGRSGDRWSTTFALQAGVEEPIWASQRDFMADTRNGPLGSLTNPALSLAALRINTATGALGTSVYYPGQEACDRFGYTTVTTAARGTYCGGFTQSASRTISNKDKYFAGYNYTSFDLTDTTQLYGSINVYKSNAESSSGTEFWSTTSSPFNRTPPTALAPFGSQLPGYYDSNLNQFTMLQRVFNPFELGGNEAATTKYDELTYDILFGASGTFADRFDWEAGISYGKYEYEANQPRLLAKGVSDYFLGQQQGWRASPQGALYPIYALNVDRWNTPITPDIYRSFSTRAKNTAETTSSMANFNISGDLFELPAGAVGFAGVLEVARQTFDLNSDPRTSLTRPYDDQTIYNLTSSGRTKGDRDRYAAGLELRIPIFSSLTANIAGRYDKYDDITAVDDAVTSMAGLEWRPFDRLLLRGSYSTSFRAPDMQMVFAEGAGSFSAAVDQYACRAGVGVADGLGPRSLGTCQTTQADPTVYTIQTAVAGNSLLEEEKGTSYGFGFVWDVIDNMSVSVDYWRIKLEDQALQLTAATLLANEANCRLGSYPNGDGFEHSSDSAYCQNVYNLVQRSGGSTTGPIQRINSAYINAALSDKSGIDATYKYRLDTDRIGTFKLDLGYSLTLTDKYKQFEEDELIDYRDTPSLYDSRSRVRGSLNWTMGDWSTTVFGVRYGTMRNSANADFTNAAGVFSPLRLKPYMLYNLAISRKFGTQVEATLQVANVLNNLYRKDSSQAYPYFSAYNGSDPYGRRFNFSVAYKF
ncbi:TonB-dependent receptor domain-containing protein [Stenotrophomonas humi]|uniref:TonB-dependent receptor domain-containing protein n=1 Tax=Stenotrophomonas humi TaxID=405444 RepID=UPI00070CB7D3|nr:TonB-dependent receptor [Stenotrophomonas humi]